MREMDLLNYVRLEAAKRNVRLWRNNTGAVHYEDRFIRYGLANESEKLNTVLKSSDLIGIKPIIITEDHVGETIGQFVSLEIKSKNWTYVGNRKEKAQKAWLDLISELGGDARFINDIERIF